MLEQHIEAIKNDAPFILALRSCCLEDMVVQGDCSQEYWVQRPDELDLGETEICTVEELIEWLSRN